ncbi:MAG: glycosyltransferase family 4 protein [Verrucomicrobiae bacterium]|nr:glycosyltransferase family 4 protein [Verrucomicrobiae bacterium]
MRVCIVPEYPVSLMTGGLQVQAYDTFKALQKFAPEVSVSLFNWSENKELADVYHFIGFPPYISRVMELVKHAGKPYIITMLFGCPTSRLTLCFATMRRWMKSEILRLRSRQDAILNAAAIITITETDAHALKMIHGVPSDKIHVVPNGIDDAFFNATPDTWQKTFGDTPFILTVGAVQPRKNQLMLLQAANRVKLPVVIIGPTLPGWEEYAVKLEAEQRINAGYGGRWLHELTNENPLLPSAYAACRLFALLSSEETQPLSVLQAMAARKPVLLLKSSYTKVPPFDKLPETTGQNIEGVAMDLKKHFERGTPTSLSEEFRWKNIVNKLVSIYRQAIQRNFTRTELQKQNALK